MNPKDIKDMDYVREVDDKRPRCENEVEATASIVEMVLHPSSPLVKIIVRESQHDNAFHALMNGCKKKLGQPASTANRFPSCFYADDAYTLDVGLFRSQFLLRIARHITAPNPVMDGARTLKQVSHARAHPQLQIPVLSGMYNAFHDGTYDYQKLFDSVIVLIADADHPWAIETLKRYKKGVFGGVKGSNPDEEDSGNGSDSETAAILACRGACSSAISADVSNT
ncbi:hypothetical protein B0H19DRAFT_1245460 [Mycena capillaripes]|nr:hypothetical protein B0H19DRAFT_1245460 [Mycena capillaripes]